MNPPSYSNVMEGKDKESRFQHRLRMVRHAQAHGIRVTERVFRCSRNTVRKWLRRYEAEGVKGLEERSRAPHRIPHKTSPAEEAKVVAARQQVPNYGPDRLKEWFDLEPSPNTIGRILKDRGLTKPKRKKRHKQADLRAVKAQYPALTHLQMDVKYLWDIPQYWPQMQALGLPKYEYTIRDTKSGAVFLGFGHQVTVTYASLLIQRCLNHLERYGIAADRVTVQTDRGSEFSGGQRRKRDFGFVHVVEQEAGAEHLYTPPRWPNANADVEALHRIIEEELFDLEVYRDLEDFLRKATVYQHFFNYARPNSYKGRKTPWEIVAVDHPRIRPGVLALPPVLLEAEFEQTEQVGQDVPGFDAGARPPYSTIGGSGGTIQMAQDLIARLVALATVALIGLSACDVPSGDPLGIANLPPADDLTQFITGDIAQQLTPQDQFPVLLRGQGARPMIDSHRAGALAKELMANYGWLNRALLERQHGAPIDFGALEVGKITFAESPHAPLAAEVPNFAHKYFGPFFLVTLEAEGEPKVRVAVSAYAGDIAFKAGQLVYLGVESGHGNEFRWEGYRTVSPPVSAEQAAIGVAAFSGAKVSNIPVFVRRDGSFSPFHGYWKIRLDRAVGVIAGDELDRRSTTAEEFFVDDRGNLMVSAGDHQPRRAAQPALRAPQVRRYSAGPSGLVGTVNTPPNHSVPVDLTPVVALEGGTR